MPKGIPYMAGMSCSVGGCEKPACKRAMCDGHYARWRRWGDPNGGVLRASGTPFERVEPFLVRHLDTGCWEWTRSLNGAGYGMVHVPGRAGPQRVHRVVYEAMVGEIPEGTELDHLCRNRKCAEPTHLEAVSHAENTRRGWWATKDRCVNGHSYAEHGFLDRGRRACRECRRRPPTPRPDPRPCEVCGDTFQPTRNGHLRCSQACNWQAFAESRRPRGGAA